ncbi:kunitz trypsin inhibitor 5-like [Amaranthus tricolor]|uniref:kunitz trypsin inhibitor 5-like n=1 Tax=Amaranthus tricolor TaxID=29722 RepID=UPI00258BD14A|nr:kunitz trypsin inhibitor 5-like [Amaranthus tricolor]
MDQISKNRSQNSTTMNQFNVFSSTTIFLFLIVVSSKITTAVETNLVRDINGHPLKPNYSYHILPVIRGRGGGLTLTPKNKTESCPLFVAQENHEVSNGLTLKFYPVNPKDKKVSLSFDLNIVFDAATICVQSTVWKLTIDEVSGRAYVGTGGMIGNPAGLESVDNWFKIEKAGKGKDYYKIVFCPSVCKFCKVMCGDIGVFVEDDGRRLLGFRNEQPLLVMFKKA